MFSEFVTPSEHEVQPTIPTLWRLDLYDNEFRIPASFETLEEAEAERQRYTDLGHHQKYKVVQMDPTDLTEFIPGPYSR